MKIQINLKLQLAKESKKIIKVSYHTFETATYDTYLMASLALRSTSEDEAYQYIDDISGNGSLNAHFKSIYDELVKLSKEDLQSVLNNSLVPTLKIDSSNWYDYYLDLDISVFKKRIYKGDLGSYPNVPEILHIQDEIVSQEVVPGKVYDRPETYLVRMTDAGISVNFFDNWVDMSVSTFEESLISEVTDLDGYLGEVHDKADGDGWYILSKTKLNNLLMSNGYFYDDDGNYCLIRNYDVRKTIIAFVNGLYIYKELSLDYKNNEALCRKVLSVITDNAMAKASEITRISILLQNVNVKTVQMFINDNYGSNYPREIGMFVINCIKRGCTTGWRKGVLQQVLVYCDKALYPTIYRMNDSLEYSLEQLIVIDDAILNDTHKEMVAAYWNDIKEMRNSIKEIIGDITASGLRERAKALKADADTRRFTKLCNDLIGHEKRDYSKASKQEVESWLKAALELKDLQSIIEKRLADNK